MSFNTGQREAINCETNLVVLAPPGSGKTGTITAKAIHILRTIPGSRVAMLTFTNAATKELVHRMKEQLSAEEFKRVMIATFHSHCMDMLRKAQRLGRILGPADGFAALRQAMSRCDYAGSFEEAVGELETHKRSLDFKGDETPLVEAYEEIRRRHRASDMNDIVRDAVKGLKEGTLNPLPVTHLLADEVQDSDLIQLTFMILHAQAGAIVTIVGDDDQSIYAFRGSLGYEGMLAFEQQTQARRIVLEINYRSHVEILDAAGAVIRNNTARVPKIVHSAKGPGGTVSIKRAPSRALECKIVADMIKEDVLPNEDGEIVAPKGRWAVIARTNSSFRLLVGEFKAAGIAYQRLGGSDEIPEDAQALMAFLCSLQTGDSLGLEGMLLRAGIHHTAVNGLINYFGNECHRFLDGELPELDRPLPEDLKLIKSIASLCQRWRESLAEGYYGRVIDAVAIWFLDNGLVKSKTPDEDFNYWVSLLNRSTGSLTRRTERLMRKKENKDEGGVVLTTMHTSKGLEFDRVIIIQSNAGVIPSSNNPSVEEERRLFFVAITRAKKDLSILFQSVPGPSPFIAEIERSGLNLRASMAS